LPFLFILSVGTRAHFILSVNQRLHSSFNYGRDVLLFNIGLFIPVTKLRAPPD